MQFHDNDKYPHDQSTCLTLFDKQKVQQAQFYRQNSIFTMMPIHTLNQSSNKSYNQCKKVVNKPAFGTTACRQQKIFNGNKQSDIVAYSKIIYQKNQKYQDKYQDLNVRKAPFMTSTLRFNLQKIKNPGPGTYSIQQTFNNLNNSQNKNHIKNFTINRFKLSSSFRDKKHNTINQFQQIQKQNETSPGPNHYMIEQQNNNNKIKELIKRKQIQKRQQILKLKQLMKKQHRNNDILKQNLFTKVKGKQNEQTKEQIKSVQNKNFLLLKQLKQKPLNLHQITSKYLPKISHTFDKSQSSSNNLFSQSKVSRMQYNFMPKSNKSSNSYVKINQAPDSGLYEGRMNNLSKKVKLSAKMHQFMQFKI